MTTNRTENGTDLNPHLSLLAVQAFFGSLPVIAKVVLNVVPGTALVGFRVGLTALVLFVFQRLRGNLQLRERGDYMRLAVLSLFGVTLNQLLFIGGLSLTKASNTSLLAVTIPIFTLLVSATLRTESLRLVKVFGILLAAAGVIFLLDPRNAGFSSETTTGDILIILNSLSYGIYVATSKNVITRNGAMRSITWIFIFSSLVCVPLGAFSLAGTDISNIGSAIWLLVLYISVIATAVPYFLNAWALARVNPSTVAVYVYLQPLIGFILAVVFLGEKIDIKFVVAAVLIFAGVMLATRTAPRVVSGQAKKQLDLSSP
jgi:drug/metabolite transporter (DMT)-like permease